MEASSNKKFMDFVNNEQVRSNAESAVSAIAAFLVVLITKGFMGTFEWGLFFTIEPYASAIGVGLAVSIMQNNMITRGVSDEIADNPPLLTLLDDVGKLDSQITDYDYADYFIEQYNKKEFERLQKIASDKEIRKLKYLISIRKSMKKKYYKLSQKLSYVIEYGAKVRGYKRVTLQDLLSFQASNELKGKDKINFDPIKVQRKGMLKSRMLIFISSGLMAGLPLASSENKWEVFIFLCVWVPMLCVTAIRTYIKSRKITKTTYYKTLQYKKNVLKLCIDAKVHYTPKEEPINKESVVEEIIQIEKKEENK